MPVRIQRKRTKGWRMPENTVCVTRGTKFGNDFKIGGTYKIDWEYPCIGWGDAIPFVKGELVTIDSNEMAVEYFKKWLKVVPFSQVLLSELKGKNLACFCSLDKPCHADVLLKIANE